MIYIPVVVVTAPLWACKRRADWGERFGKIAPVVGRGGCGGGPARRRVLIHTVSVGETAAIRELVPLLTPHVQVIVSAATDTGLKRARELYGATCDVVRYPLDASWAVKRFLDATSPDAVALVELELWPNFVRECARRGIPMGVINGRLSEGSFRGYRKIRAFMRGTFGAMRFVGAQDEAYAERFVAMGVPPDRCVVTGSMKWDTARIEDLVAGAEELAREMGIDRARPLVVAGSTAEGEEALLHAACPEGAQLLCAPRKPERFDDAAAALPGCVRRTAKDGRRGTPSVSSPRFLLDTIGELRKAYALADVVVMGRTFGDLGGSDPVEPVGLGKATVVGPAVEHFASIVEAFEKGGGVVRATRESVARVIRELLESPAWRREIAERGRVCIREHQGASARHSRLILELLRESASAHPAAAGASQDSAP